MTTARAHIRRGQGGFTLLEVMLTVMVSAMIAVPLLAWAVVGTRTQTRVHRASTVVTSRNLLSSYFPKDVASSVSAQAGGTDCTGGSGAGGVVVLTLATSTSRIVYSVAAVASPSPGSVPAPTDGSVWRRVCDASGAATDTTMLIGDAVMPTGGWSGSLVCADRAGRTGDTCGQMTLSFSVRDAASVRSTAVRRIGGPQ